MPALRPLTWQPPGALQVMEEAQAAWSWYAEQKEREPGMPGAGWPPTPTIPSPDLLPPPGGPHSPHLPQPLEPDRSGWCFLRRPVQGSALAAWGCFLGVLRVKLTPGTLRLLRLAPPTRGTALESHSSWSPQCPPLSGQSTLLGAARGSNLGVASS